jgi:hypothetical protein
VSLEGIGETVAGCDGSADTAHFETEAEVVVESFKSVGVVEDDVAEAKGERDQGHPEKRGSRSRPPCPPFAFRRIWLN